jgi:hypothetical protein
MLTELISVRCDACGAEYSYRPEEVLRAEIAVPEHFIRIPLFK